MDLNKVKLVLAVTLAALTLLLATAGYSAKPPKLVLQITVDALRGDLPTRYYGIHFE